MPCLVGKTRIHISVTASLISPLFVICSANCVGMIRLDVYRIASTPPAIKSEHAPNTDVLFMVYFDDSFQMQTAQTFCLLEQILDSRV